MIRLLTFKGIPEDKMQKNEFRQQATAALVNGDILNFQKAVKARLYDNFNQSLEKFNFNVENKLTEDLESDVRADIEAAARSLGGNNPIYDQGVLAIDFENKKAVEDFSDWLDACDNIESYEINILFDNENEDTESKTEIELDDIKDDTNYTFEFIIYLDPEIVTYSDEGDEEEVNEETLTEVKRLIKTTSTGTKISKTIKMKCNPGMKWDDASNSCQKIGGIEKANMRKGAKKRIISMKSRGAGAKAKTLKKMRRTLKFRKALGL